MLEYKQESLESSWNDFYPLLEKHFKENYPADLTFNPDYLTYYHMSLANRIKIFTVRDDGKPVGYMSILISPHLHCKDVVWAMTDAVYVDPEYRNKGVFQELQKFVEKNIDADFISYGAITHKFEKFFTKDLR